MRSRNCRSTDGPWQTQAHSKRALQVRAAINKSEMKGGFYLFVCCRSDAQSFDGTDEFIKADLGCRRTPNDLACPFSDKQSAEMLVDKQQVGRGKYNQDPEHFGNEQMRHLQPNRRQQDDVQCAESNLSRQCDGKNEPPGRATWLSPKLPKQPKNVNGSYCCCNWVEEPEPQQCVAAGREILHQCVP